MKFRRDFPKDELIKEYNSGMTQEQLAKKYQSDATTIRKRLRFWGVTLRTKTEMQIGRKNHQYGNIGEQSPNFKREGITYNSLHAWVRKHKPKPNYCMSCGQVKPLLEIACKGKYDRNFDNYEWLCRKCHMIKDGRLDNLLRYRRTFLLFKRAQ